MKKLKLDIRENQIEDIFATYPELMKEILDISEDLTLISRQKILPSGNKIDLLFITGKKILLVELKVEIFRKEYFEQIKDYASELLRLQKEDKFIDGDIIPYLLCTNFRDSDKKLCKKGNVFLVKYSPADVLQKFFVRLKILSNFISLKPTNHGLWNIHLLNKILYILDNPKSDSELIKDSGVSKSTAQSYLKLAQELLLVNKINEKWALTETGKKYVCKRNAQAPIEVVSDEQSHILQNIIIHNPFESGAIFGIYTVVESVFNLSKNTYPVPQNLLMDYFRQSSGKYFEWRFKKTAFDSMKMYSNYSIDIGLLGRIGDKFYLTPDGIRFILLLNLYKAIKIIDALGISKKEVEK